MKKQIISVIIASVFFWSNFLWAGATHPQPTGPQAQSNAPSAPANPDALKLAVEPVIKFTTDNILVICAANCGSTAASNFYAYNNGASFTDGTQAWAIEETGTWFVLYQLPGATWQRVTNSMLGKAPSATETGSATDNNTHKNQPSKVHYRVWKKQGKKWQEVNLDNSTTSVMVVPVYWDEKGRPINFTMIAKDRQTGHIIIQAQNVKITHWAKTVRTLGIATALTVGFYCAIFYAPGVILAATPFP